MTPASTRSSTSSTSARLPGYLLLRSVATELTMDNTATYSAIPGLDDGRKVFVVVAFEGVFSITSENKVFLRVQPVLLRYVLLDVDGTLPRRISTPTRDPYCSNPPDDFDD